MAAALILRLRLPSGQATISIAADAPFSTLLTQVAESAGVPADVLALSSGFPPQALALEESAPISDALHHMDTITVAVTAGAPAMAPAPAKRGGRGRGASSSARGAAGRASPAAAGRGGGGVVTLADMSGGGGSAARKRPAAASGGGASGASARGGGGGGKRRAVGALQLGSEEGIGASLLSAVGSKKGSAPALHGEDPAAAFLKAAASSALAHHVEEVHANERFQAALALASGGTGCQFIESDVERRLDGTATQCDVRFKVGRAMRVETFALFSRPELRAVLRTVLEQLGGGGNEGNDNEDEDERPTSLELLKPFKMAHASPRVFWNLAREFGGDVARGLHELLPQQDWSFLEEREKKRSSKARANARVAAEEAAAKAERAAQRQARARAPASAPAGADGVAASVAAVSEAAAVGEAASAASAGAVINVSDEDEEEVAEEEGEVEEEPAADDADGWEARGRRAMLHDREYDYACVCLNRALRLRLDRAGARESAESDSALAPAWYLHGSALLRRAQALAHTMMEAAATADGSAADDVPTAAAGRPTAAAQAAQAALPPEWQMTGSAAIGRRVRRFFALHGMADGTVVAWQPPIEGGRPEADAVEEGEEALFRIAMDDGDVEDLDEEELDDALKALGEGRTVAAEVEELLEAAWEALEMAAALFELPESNGAPEAAAAAAAAAVADDADSTSARSLGAAEAHERLGDCALQNDQPERALEEYTLARTRLHALQRSGRLAADDRRLADIEWFLGVTQLQLGRAGPAVAHYRQAAATLRLRAALLERRAQDRTIARLAREAGGEAAASAEVAAVDDEMDSADAERHEGAQIAELLAEIEARIAEVQSADSSKPGA